MAETYSRLDMIPNFLHHYRFQWNIDLVYNFIVLIMFLLSVLFQILIFMYLVINRCAFRNRWPYQKEIAMFKDRIFWFEFNCFVLVCWPMAQERMSHVQQLEVMFLRTRRIEYFYSAVVSCTYQEKRLLYVSTSCAISKKVATTMVRYRHSNAQFPTGTPEICTV